MNILPRKVGSHWFAAAPAARPAMLRILIGAYSFTYVWNRREMLDTMTRNGDPNLYEPVGLTRLHGRRLPVPLVRGIVAVTLATNVAFVFGWRHQVTGPLYSGLFFWLMSYRNSWSMIHHSDNVLVFHLLILGHTPAADALSLDARRGGAPALPSLIPFGPAASRHPAGDWQYGWPLQLMNAVTVATYFLAGVAKLKGPSGLEWASGEQLRRQIAVDALRKEVLGKPAAPMAYTLYRQDGLFRILAVGSLVIETLAPLVLADKRLARFWALNAWAMHWGILALMNITFRYQLSGLMYLSFFDIERLLDAAMRWADQQLREGETSS
ncbi:MAG: hypothetical protein H0V37_13870 [Chloroflexia bacterium]|nr:hypothetical protein [Chloroflexia bacterium]